MRFRNMRHMRVLAAGLTCTATSFAFAGTAGNKGPTIVEAAEKNGSFTTLLAALDAADLRDALNGKGPFTVFAPTDEAFANVPKATLEALLQPANKERLQDVLKYHVLPASVTAKNAIASGSAKTLQGSKVTIGLDGGRLKINSAGVVVNDLMTANGVIHVIDEVLLPPDFSLSSGRKIIGIYTGTPGKVLRTQLGLDNKFGIVVTGLTRNGPAKEAGIKQYDVIAEIDGLPANDDVLAAAKERAGVGNAINLRIIRNGKSRQVSVPVIAVSH